jgi:hypothetical protein
MTLDVEALACAGAAARIAAMRLLTKRSRSHNKRTNLIAEYSRLTFGPRNGTVLRRYSNSALRPGLTQGDSRTSGAWQPRWTTPGDEVTPGCISSFIGRLFRHDDAEVRRIRSRST